MGTALKELSEKDVYTASFQKLSDKLETLPNTFTQYLSMIKSELYACIHNEFQVPSCILLMNFLVTMEDNRLTSFKHV